MADKNTSNRIKEELKQQIPKQYKREAEAAEGFYDDIRYIQDKTVKKTGQALDASAIPDYVDAGMKAAEKGGLQGNVNKFVLYLDNPENTKTTKVINQIRKYWNKLPGLVQAKIIHDLTSNDPAHTFLRILAKTGILQYKREKKADDTITIGKKTAAALIFMFKIIKPFIKELQGVDSKIVDGIMTGVGFAENIAYKAKLELIEARVKRMGMEKTSKFYSKEDIDAAMGSKGGSVTPITEAKAYKKTSGNEKPNPKRVRNAA